MILLVDVVVFPGGEGVEGEGLAVVISCNPFLGWRGCSWGNPRWHERGDGCRDGRE